MHGFTDSWVYGFTDLRIYGFRDLRIYGFTDFRILGFTDLRIFTNVPKLLAASLRFSRVFLVFPGQTLETWTWEPLTAPYGEIRPPRPHPLAMAPLAPSPGTWAGIAPY